MLIAMMTRSYETIHVSERNYICFILGIVLVVFVYSKSKKDHSDTEWKFSRSKLFMEFIKESSIVPVPFNIFMLPLTCASFIKEVVTKFRKKQSNGQDFNSNHIEMNHVRGGGGNNAMKNGNANGLTVPKPVINIYALLLSEFYA